MDEAFELCQPLIVEAVVHLDNLNLVFGEVLLNFGYLINLKFFLIVYFDAFQILLGMIRHLLRFSEYAPRHQAVHHLLAVFEQGVLVVRCYRPPFVDLTIDIDFRHLKIIKLHANRDLLL